jgi:uncharacterized protein
LICNFDFCILIFDFTTVPANLTPMYKKAEEWFKSATTNQEKILALEEMLRTLPKHKGTEKIQAELRKKLSHLREAPAEKKGGAHADIFHIPRGGAGQIALLGTPNCGKSSIVAALTNAKVTVADFPFATSAPVPGMVTYEDVQIQLVDMPPITAEYVAPNQVGTYRNCDIIAAVIDLSADVAEQMLICMDFLESHKLLADTQTPDKDEQGNTIGKKTICISTKSDIAPPDAMQKLKDFYKRPIEYLEVSTVTYAGLDIFPKKLFELLGIIRIYSKPPGKPADMKEPFTIPKGSTVMDLAVHIHRQLAEKLKTAKIWGTGVYAGQNVQRTHILNDKDIVELHFN